jgi:hypothetical protein
MKFRFQNMSKLEIIRVVIFAAFCGVTVGLFKALSAKSALHIGEACLLLLAVYVFIDVMIRKL